MHIVLMRCFCLTTEEMRHETYLVRTEEEKQSTKDYHITVMKDDFITGDWKHLINHLTLVLCRLTFH